VTYEQRTVVRVPFPFTDADRSKERPALVLSTAKFNREHGHIVLAMITSAKHTRWPTDIPITALDAAGLKVPSVIRFKLFTLDERLIMGSLGTLADTDWNVVRVALLDALGL
jgi:mRNA interferase MazF